MTIKNKKLFLALEELEEQIPEEPIDLETAEVEAEEASVDVNNDVEEHDDLVAAIEEAEADAETLQDMQDVMEESVEVPESVEPAEGESAEPVEGEATAAAEPEGISEQAAEIAEIAIESICNRLGIKVTRRLLPATEEFADDNKKGKVEATKEAIGKFKEVIKKILEGIARAMALVWEKIKAFVLKLVQNTEKLGTNLKALQSAVQGMDDQKENYAKKEISDSYAKAFAINDQASAKTVETILSNTEALLLDVRKAKAGIGLIGTGIKKVLNSNVDDLLGSALGIVNEVSGYEKTFQSLATENKELINGKGVKVELIDSKIGDNEFKFPIASIDTLQTYKNVSIKPGSKTELSAILTKAISLTNNIKSFRDVISGLENDKNEIDKAVKKTISSGIKSDNAEVSATFRELSSIMNHYNKNTQFISLPLPALAFNTAKTAGDYVNACVKASESGESGSKEVAEVK